MVLAKPVLALLYSDRALLEDFLADLCLERRSEEFYFESVQRYYSKEMGSPLHKVFVSLKCLMRREELREFKLWSMRKEEEYKADGRRRLNIDPGYVDESHLVLASSKKRGGRFYLGGGVFAEMEYLFVYGSFRPLYWTYADYRDKRVRAFFELVREDFLESLKLANRGNKLILCRFSEDELYEEVHAV